MATNGRRIQGICAVLLVAVGLWAWWSDVATWIRPSPGRIDHLRLVFPSTGKKPRDVYVYVPPGYNAKHRRFPVVYALHGWPGQPSDFFRKGRISDTAEKLTKAGDIKPMLIVAPNGGGLGLLGFGGWANSQDGRCRLEDYVAKDLVKEIDQRYRTVRSPASRVLMGISEGAYGAANTGLKHPEVFGLIVCHSGHYKASTSSMSRPTFGTGPSGRAYRRANSPLVYLARWKKAPTSLNFFIDTTGEDSDKANTEAFVGLLRKRGIPLTFEVAKGRHSWRLWRNRFPISLKWISARL